MKIFGYILLIFGILNFLIGFIALTSEGPDVSGRFFTQGPVLGVLGFFLINRANKKKREEQEKDDWEKGV